LPKRVVKATLHQRRNRKLKRDLKKQIDEEGWFDTLELGELRISSREGGADLRQWHMQSPFSDDRFKVQEEGSDFIVTGIVAALRELQAYLYTEAQASGSEDSLIKSIEQGKVRVMRTLPGVREYVAPRPGGFCRWPLCPARYVDAPAELIEYEIDCQHWPRH